MVNNLPVKNLVRLNWVISFMMAVVIAAFLAATALDIKSVAMRFAQTFLFVSITGFCNLFFWGMFSADKQPPVKYFKIKFYLASYLMAIVAWFLVRGLYSLVTGFKWEGEGEHIRQAYILGVLAVWILNTLIVILQNLVILQHKKAQGEIENLQLKANVTETANLLLRQQIHPHFLFNALNTIKSLYKNDLQQGENYLVHLANFLRVSISNPNTKTTLVKDELEFCMDYLQMQKIRFGTALEYAVDIAPATVLHKYLPYFSLQPLVENVLKHNDLTEERPILITIKEEDGYLVISNNLQPRSYKEVSTGLGLANLAERYRLLGEPGIVIKAADLFFSVRIKILDK